ncbi:MAG TPA: hypothetical protein VL854_08060 [Nitrososphaeraceae archaeon]|nr:hypothetical protein [Nitrososphaeraceae archaeon]
MVDSLPYIIAAGALVSAVWGVLAIRDILKKNKLTDAQQRRDEANRIIEAVDSKLGIIKTQAQKDRELFLAEKTEKDSLILTLKEDIHVLEKHLEELCKSVSKHEGILEQQAPALKQVTDSINDLKIQVGILEKGLN